MAFFKVSTSQDQIKDTGDAGIYEFIIKNAIVTESANGSTSISLYINYNGQDQVIYNAFRLTNADGTPNFSANQMNKLCAILGMQDGEEIPDPVKMKLPIGKGGEPKECLVLEYFNDVPIKAKIQFQYRMWEGKVIESKNIRNFYRAEDNATASEILNCADLGKQYEIDLETADKVMYMDGLTKEDVEQAIKDRRAGKNTEVTPSNQVQGPRRFGKR